ncbi:hypothetical protein [Metallibacterium scheffleri]|uniref:hypothetical protein n=1 Tax=Metallibacterium scheffleri TaxID=993689 RepID=UPI0010A03EBA|nr:hypothetical protein [Metallibacterium scheffleri]
MPGSKKSSRLSDQQTALLISLYSEIRSDEHPGHQSIECSPEEKQSALALSRRGYLVVNDEPNAYRSFTVFMTASGIDAAKRLATGASDAP